MATATTTITTAPTAATLPTTLELRTEASPVSSRRGHRTALGTYGQRSYQDQRFGVNWERALE